MNNDNRDDQDNSPEGDAEQQLGFDSDSFEPASPGNRQDRFFSSFDDETTEIDDIEPGDYGDDFDTDSDLSSDDPRDDTIDLWGEDDDNLPESGSDSGLNAAEELKALWDDDPEPSVTEAEPEPSESTANDPDVDSDDAPDFANWPHDEPEEDASLSEVLEKVVEDGAEDSSSPNLEPDEGDTDEAIEAADNDREFESELARTESADPVEDQPEEPDLWEAAEDEVEPAAGIGDEWSAAATAALSTATSASPGDPEPEDTDNDWESALEDDELDESWDEGDDDWDDDEEPDDRQLPWGLIAVAVVALLLLGVGGFGVLQERSSLQEEVTELRSQLATSASPEEVTAARESVRSLEESNQTLEGEIARLELENRRLTDMVAGLESQLKNQSAAVEELERSAEQAREAAARQSTTSGSSASAGTGTWFVNFGSYGNREAAETWATRLRKDYGKVIVAPAASQGRSLYRVRVIGLPSKAEAERVARELEQAHDLTKLWVGSE